MPAGLKRYYGQGHLHFITCSCYQRQPLLDSGTDRDLFVKVLGEVRERYQFLLVGYVVMPEHVHLLISEPAVGTPSTVMQVLKQRTSRMVGKQNGAAEGPLWFPRFHDFNVWSEKKKNEKLNYMHMNPVERGLVSHPKDWPWSSYAFYATGVHGPIRMDLA